MLTQSFAPIVGGEERIVEDLSVELARRGHEVAIATLRQPGSEPAPCGDGVRVHALRSSTGRIGRIRGAGERLHAPPGPDPETVLDLRRVLRLERPQVVHAHNWLVHSYLPLDRRSDAALVLSLHDYGLLCATKRLLYRGAPCSGPGPLKCLQCARSHYGWATGLVAATGVLTRESKVRRHVDVFLPISSTVERLCRLGAGDVSRVVPDFIRGLPPSPPADDPRLARLPAEPFVLFFGDVTEDKGARHLAEAYGDLDRPPPLVLIGRCFLDELAELPGVHALGAWPHELAIEAVRRCLFAVAPSIWPEPFGLVALEAAAAGKPVVASDIGGLKDIVVDGETGLLVPPGERGALRAALRRLIADEPLRARLGAAGARRAAASFSPQSLVPETEAAYELALEIRRDRARSKQRQR